MLLIKVDSVIHFFICVLATVGAGLAPARYTSMKTVFRADAEVRALKSLEHEQNVKGRALVIGANRGLPLQPMLYTKHSN